MVADLGLDPGNAIVGFAVWLGTLLAGGLIGNLLAYWGQELRKRRDLELVALQEFYRIYGEFFATWKVWNDSTKHLQSPPPDLQWIAHGRAATAEGAFEALLVKVTSERRLDDPDADDLARMRQGFQTIRETIRSGERIAMHADPTKEGAKEYAAYKELASRIAFLLARSSLRNKDRARSPKEAASALKKATSVDSRVHWFELDAPAERASRR